MNLHEETQTFKAAIQLASSPVEEGGLGINEVFLEKDYWICRSLKQLSRSKAVDVAVFKGGTSLSKAHNLGDRFSEDIDIAILNDRNLPENQTKKVIHEITKVMSQGLVEVLKPDTRKYSKYRKVYYEYPKVTENNQIVSVNSGQILLEVVSFANPYPYHKVFIKSFITEYLEKSGRVDVIKKFNLDAFEINVLDKTRTATEKIVSLVRHSLADDYITQLKAKIRHFYDLYFLWNDIECRNYLTSSEYKLDFKALLEHDQQSFKEPIGWSNKTMKDSPLVKDINAVWSELQSIYVKEMPELAYKEVPNEKEIFETTSTIFKLLS
jgi:predicted nucleotidyltransferase component of viral defense system